MENETHIVTKPNQKLKPMDELRQHLEGAFLQTVTDHYRGNSKEALSFKTACVDYVRKTPKLLQCDRMSLLSAFVQAAQLNLMPSSVMSEAYIIPYGTEAKFQPGYQGLATLAWRSGNVKALKSVIVYKNDRFEYSEGLDTKLYHVPTSFGQSRGEAVGVYAVADTTNGGKLYKVMSKEQVMAIKAMSKAAKKPESPWNSKDPELWMWQKTCLIQLLKLLPKSAELKIAIESDYEAEGLDRKYIVAEGPAIGEAFHGPADSAPSEDGKDDIDPDEVDRFVAEKREKKNGKNGKEKEELGTVQLDAE